MPLSVVGLVNKLFLKCGSILEKLAKKLVEGVDLLALESDVLHHL